MSSKPRKPRPPGGPIAAHEAPLTRLQVRLRAEREEVLRMMEGPEPERHEQRCDELLEELLAVATALSVARYAAKQDETSHRSQARRGSNRR